MIVFELASTPLEPHPLTLYMKSGLPSLEVCYVESKHMVLSKIITENSYILDEIVIKIIYTKRTPKHKSVLHISDHNNMLSYKEI